VQFEYHVVRPDGPFSDDDLREVKERLDELPSHKWDDSSYTVFPDVHTRARLLPGLLAAPDEPDWLHGYVVVAPERVTLGLLQDPAILRHMYALVTWMQARWPGTRLEYGGVEQRPESILPDDE
jgi:hypothetical protein